MELVINGRFLAQRLSGVQRVALEITRAIDRLLDEGGYPHLSVRLAVPPGANAELLQLRRIAVQVVRGPVGQLWEQFALPFHAGSAAILSLGNTAPLLSLLAGRQVGVMLHDQAYRTFRGDYSLGYRAWHHLLDAVITRRARPLFAVSRTEHDILLSRHPRLAGRACVAANGGWTGDEASEDLPTQAASDGYGLYIGAASRRKNIDGIVAAAVAMASAGRRFVIAGSAGRRLEELRASIPPEAAELIEFRGYVDERDLPALYRGAAYLLYPSFYEASGLPPIEAMRFGSPVIVSDLAVLRERCGDAALYCDPHSVASIVARIVQLLGDQALRRSLVERGYRRAAEFTWRAQARRILEAMEAAAGGAWPLADAPVAAAAAA